MEACEKKPGKERCKNDLISLCKSYSCKLDANMITTYSPTTIHFRLYPRVGFTVIFYTTVCILETVLIFRLSLNTGT